MEKIGKYICQVAPGQPEAGDKPSLGPVYRNITAEKGFSDLQPADSLYELFQKSTRQFPDNDCLGWRPKGQGPYVFDSYTTVAEKIAAAASAMAHAGVTAHGRAGIYSVNCPEWMTVMQACNRMTVCTVPLYDTLGKDAVEYVTKHSETSIIFVSTENWGKLATALPALKGQVQTVVYWGSGGVNEQEATSLGIKVYSFVDFLAIGRAHPAEALPPKTDDICTIMYTSGTTGQPKGVVITHRMLLATLEGFRGYIDGLSYVDSFSDDDTVHSFRLLTSWMVEEMMLYIGGKIGYYSGSLGMLVDDIAALRPTLFVGVPRVWERVHAGVMEQLKNSRITRRWIFSHAFNRKLRFLEQGYPPDQASPFFDRLVFSKVKARLGGRVRIALSGAAPLARNVEDFMRVCLCCYFIQGYALTESCSAGFCSTGFKEHAGTVGIPAPTLDYRLQSVPEMGYDAMGSPPRGEILMRGPCIFPGYYKEADLTARVLDKEGWFHTGDIGEQTPAEALTIIDRKKEIFKLSQGEYCSPAKVETAYLQLPLIAQLFVYANFKQTALVAVVVPEEGRFVAAARKAGLAGSFQELTWSPVAKSTMLREMGGIAKTAGLKGFEMVRGIILEAEPFSVENNLLTPTLKLKRPQLQAKYKKYACQTN